MVLAIFVLAASFAACRHVAKHYMGHVLPSHHPKRVLKQNGAGKSKSSSMPPAPKSGEGEEVDPYFTGGDYDYDDEEADDDKSAGEEEKEKKPPPSTWSLITPRAARGC